MEMSHWVVNHTAYYAKLSLIQPLIASLTIQWNKTINSNGDSVLLSMVINDTCE